MHLLPPPLDYGYTNLFSCGRREGGLVELSEGMTKMVDTLFPFIGGFEVAWNTLLCSRQLAGGEWDMTGGIFIGKCDEQETKNSS